MRFESFAFANGVVFCGWLEETTVPNESDAMDTANNPYDSSQYSIAAAAAVDERASFITKTYLHLAGAIGLLVIIETALQASPIAEQATMLMTRGRYGWLIVMGLFMGVSWLAESWANSSTSRGVQYAGLALYTIAEAIILMPLIFVASRFYPNAITSAGIATLGLTAVMTTIVFVTRKDFSFMRTGLMFAGFAAMGIIVVAIVGGFNLGPIFSVAMIALACGYILYHTSNILHHYRTDQYVAASLSLFASVALLFWYILQLFMSRD